MAKKEMKPYGAMSEVFPEGIKSQPEIEEDVTTPAEEPKEDEPKKKTTKK